MQAAQTTFIETVTSRIRMAFERYPFIAEDDKTLEVAYKIIFRLFPVRNVGSGCLLITIAICWVLR